MIIHTRKTHAEDLDLMFELSKSVPDGYGVMVKNPETKDGLYEISVGTVEEMDFEWNQLEIEDCNQIDGQAV